MVKNTHEENREQERLLQGGVSFSFVEANAKVRVKVQTHKIYTMDEPMRPTFILGWPKLDQPSYSQPTWKMAGQEPVKSLNLVPTVISVTMVP